jgi:hypothetical protein
MSMNRRGLLAAGAAMPAALWGADMSDSGVTTALDLSFPPENSRLILHDNQATGFRSWVPLHDGNQPRGMGGFDGSALVLMTEDRPAWGDNAAVFHTSAWLSRLTVPAGATRIYLRWEWAIRVWRGGPFSKGPQFGLDIDDGGPPTSTAPAQGIRYLMMQRCTLFDEAGTYYGGQWQYQSGLAAAPAVSSLRDHEGDLISPFKYPRMGVGQNYGKVLRQYTEQVINVETFRYEGLRHNGIGFGVLPTGGGYAPDVATNPRANELIGFVPASGVDAEFINGCNVYCQLDNRSNQPSKGTLYVYDVLAVAF